MIAPTVPPSWRILTDVFHPLFDTDPIGLTFDRQLKNALKSIAEQPAHELRAANLGELAARLATPHLIAPLELRWEDRRRLPNEDETEVDYGRSRRPPAVSPMGEFAFVVPYSGTLGLFDLRPTRDVGQPPSGYVWASQGLLEYSVARADVATVRRALRRAEAEIKRWVKWVNQDVSTFNAKLQRSMRERLAARLDEIRGSDDILAALDVPEATLELRPTPRDAPRHPDLASRGSLVEANGGQLPGAAEPASVPGPRKKGAGRPGWTRELFEEHWREAMTATPEPRTWAALAAHFRARDDTFSGVGGDHLRRLRTKKFPE